MSSGMRMEQRGKILHTENPLILKIIFAKIFVIFINFRSEIFVKNQNIFSQKCENENFRFNPKPHHMEHVLETESPVKIWHGNSPSRNRMLVGPHHMEHVLETESPVKIYHGKSPSSNRILLGPHHMQHVLETESPVKICHGKSTSRNGMLVGLPYTTWNTF
jgi:hypothetical protein